MRTSHLDSPGDRFLSVCLQFSLEEDWLTASDLISEFPPSVLMQALESAPELRATLLVEAAGVHEKIAPKKSTGAATEDLQIALDEEVCTPSNILELLPADELVRHLKSDDIWARLIRDEFWKQNDEKSQARMLDMIDSALELKLLELPALVTLVSPEKLATDLPRDLMEKAFTAALHAGLAGSCFDAELLKDTLEIAEWLKHVALAHFWETVITGEVAPSAGLPGKSSSSKSEGDSHTSGAPGPQSKAKATEKKNSQKKKGGKKETSGANAPSAAELTARKQAIDKLETLERLPLDVDGLATPVLLGIEAMYEDFFAVDSDEDREECLRDSFPNPKMLNEALLALVVTLDPKLTKDALQERGADTKALAQLFIFEERRRSNALAGSASSGETTSQGPISSPPPSATGSILPPPASGVAPQASASLPPPLPQQVRRASTPPPPLPAQARTRGR